MIQTAFRNAWEIYRNNLGAWLGFFVVFLALSALSGVVFPWVGLYVFLPMALRETNRARVCRVQPEIQALWNFRFLGNDLPVMLFYALAQAVGAVFLLGGLVAIVVFWFTAEIAAENRFSLEQTIRLSWAIFQRRVSETILMFLICFSPFVFGFGIGGVFFGPLVLLARSEYWALIRDEMLALDAVRTR